MGLFSFAKNVGAKIGIGGKADEIEAAQMERLSELDKAIALKKHVTDMGLKADDVKITFDDGKATLSGEVANRATKEKIVLAVGNTHGVGEVDDNLKIARPAPMPEVEADIKQAAAERRQAAAKRDAAKDALAARLEKVVEAESKFYTVKSGDTLSKIAKEHYGDASKYPLIFEANKPMLKDPDLIYPDQVLRIPAETE